jgi:parallel beta-helix repeat protein
MAQNAESEPVRALTMFTSANRYVDADGICDGYTPCYTTIQSAVNAASSGELVYIYAGIYNEHVIINKSLTLQGEDRETTIIDGGGSGDVIYVSANYVTVVGVTVRNGYNGIYLIPNWAIHHFTFRDGVVTSNTFVGIQAGHSNSSGAYHVIEDCVIANSGYMGLYAHQFSHSVIRNCDVFGNVSWALDVAWGQYTLITNNRVHDNDGAGIHLDSMTTTTVENNVSWNNGGGISIGYVGSSNVVRSNLVCNNNGGISTGSPNVNYNRIYHNDLYNNGTQAYDSTGGNYWDNSYSSGGNYWNDYTGVDTDDNGIGDTPYMFFGNRDNFPLMSPKNYQPPIIHAIAGPSQPVDIINQPVNVSAEFSGAIFSDPQLTNNHSAVWDWGDGTTSEGVVDEVNGSVSGSHSYNGTGIYELRLTMSNSVCGSDTQVYQYIEIIENTPPEITVYQGFVGVDEGQTANNSGAVSDDDGDTVTLSASVGSVTNNDDDTWSWSFQTSDGPSENQTVTINVDDGNGGTDAVSFELTVANMAPLVGSISVPIDPVNIYDQPVSANALFSDPAGSYDEPYSCTVEYGDGSAPQSSLVVSDTCLGPDHTYAESGIYAVTVTITDKEGASISATATSFIVIYDPMGGFVTGGGWIWSPAGAYAADPSLEGKATFGFVSKYQKGASLPSGNTEFQFKTGDLNFKSTSYQWLVVNKSGNNAQFKGYGTINSAGNYGFMIWATDGALDTFRIKIWVVDDEAIVVYDNGTDLSLGGGSIVVHTK